MAVSGSKGLSKALLISEADNEENLALFTGAFETLDASSFASKPMFSPSRSKSQASIIPSAPLDREIIASANGFFVTVLTGAVSINFRGSTDLQSFSSGGKS